VICREGPAVYFATPDPSTWRMGSAPSDEYRTAVAVRKYQDVPGRVDGTARAWAEGIADLLPAGRGHRLAVDLCDPAGVPALAACGIELVEGRELTEHARSIKSADELELMRWTVAVCDAAIQRMYERSAEPGRAELEIWAELHHENIRNGGEWIETRLLTSGPRTLVQEASHPAPAAGEDAVVRHRHDRPLRLLRRRLTIVDGHFTSRHSRIFTGMRGSRSTTWRSCAPESPCRVQRAGADPRPLPRERLRLGLPRRRHGRRVPPPRRPASFDGSAYAELNPSLEVGMVVSLEADRRARTR
jgi:hypothetical protein